MNNSDIARQMVMAAAKALDLNCTVTGHTAELSTGGLDLAKVTDRLETKFSIRAHAEKGKLRVEWSGAAYAEIIALIGALELAIAFAVRPRHVELGTALRAAQATYARMTSEAQAPVNA